MTITIANARDFLVDGKVVLPDERHVWVGRAVPRWGLKASPLGNPYRLGISPRDRHDLITHERAVDLYGGYFPHMVRGEDPGKRPCQDALSRLRSILKQHGRLTLVCCCETWDGEGDAPGRCHAEIIREYLLEAETGGRE